MVFRERKKDEVAPAESSGRDVIGIAPTGIAKQVQPPSKDAPSFVILPPRLRRDSESDLLAADLACERIAEELQGLAVQVVDRAYIKQIFDERTRNNSLQPMDSFDAFVRLEVMNDQLKTKAVLSMLDLSSGSPIASATFPWPIKDCLLYTSPSPRDS